MIFPKVHVCAVCEQVRPEPKNKLMILGLYGFIPRVLILVRDLSLAIGPMTFFLVCDPGKGKFKATAQIINSEKEVIFEVPEFEIDIAGKSKTVSNIIIGASSVHFPKEDEYALVLSVAGKPHYEGRFEVRQGTPD